MTNSERFPGNFWNSTFPLRVGTSISAPTNMLDGDAAAGTTDFVGDDAAHAVALPITLDGGHG